MTAIRAAIYARISKDDEDTRLGVTRQIKDCTQEAERRGWHVEQVYTDNDVSASSGRARPAFDRMIEDVKGNRLDALVVWDVDRLTRTPRELEDLIDLADAHRLALASVGGEIDLSTEQGKMLARMKGTVARYEVEQASRRIRRKFQERAENGQPHGMVAYGYQRIDGRDVLLPEQADLVRETARRLLAGETLRAIVASLNERGSRSPKGKPWESTTLRQIMLRDRNAGWRTHQGQRVGKGLWEPIYDEDTHDRVVALLTDPARRQNHGGRIRYLLTGIATCGRCDGPMRIIPRQVQKSGKVVPTRYGCRECYRVTRRADLVDERVQAVMVARLSEPDALSALASGQPERAKELRSLIDGAKARMDLAADALADGDMTREQVARVNKRLRPQVEAWQQELAACAPMNGLTALTGEDALDRWLAAPLDVKRAAVDLLMRVRILPVGTGKRWDPASVEVTWR